MSGFRRAQTLIAAYIEDLSSHSDDELRPVDAGGTDVFVVHGHDQTLQSQVARFLERLGLNPIILHEQPNSGRTILEKFEAHALQAGFAVVLLTADDYGYASGERPPTGPNRARQNVVLELGYFMGALGRNRTAALYESGVELPSDLEGLVYISAGEGWPLQLARELRHAGVPVDLNRL